MIAASVLPNYRVSSASRLHHYTIPAHTFLQFQSTCFHQFKCSQYICLKPASKGPDWAKLNRILDVTSHNVYAVLKCCKKILKYCKKILKCCQQILKCCKTNIEILHEIIFILYKYQNQMLSKMELQKGPSIWKWNFCINEFTDRNSLCVEQTMRVCCRQGTPFLGWRNKWMNIPSSRSRRPLKNCEHLTFLAAVT